MATTVARGSHMNSMYIKPMLRKAYHKKSSGDVITDAVKFNGEEMKNKGNLSGERRDREWWVPDNRTGIYYPKGQEKVIGEVPAGKDFDEINWFSNNDSYFN